MLDRRRSERRIVNRLAKIQCGADTLPRDCLVTDISDTGVRLHVEHVVVPDRFTLWLNGVSERRRECRVAWRLGFELGAAFVPEEDAVSREVIESVRSFARAKFAESSG